MATAITDVIGRPGALLAAIALIALWLPSYFLFHDVNAWQLPVNTATTIITFLVAFCIQSTQNRESKAMHVKLDAIIKVHDAISDRLLGIEAADDGDIRQMGAEVRDGTM